MSKAISQAAFARENGWVESFVTKLKHDGRLVMNADGKVMADESLTLIRETEGGRPDVASRHAKARSRDKSADRGDVEERVASTYQASRALNEKYKAMRTKLEYELAAGNVIARENVESAFRFVGGALAGLLENLPGQYASLLAPVTDTDDMERLLAEMCETMRTQFGESINRQQREIHERPKQ